VYGGDDESGKGVAAGLIRDVGFDPVDAGPPVARYTEPFALLVARLAYDGGGSHGSKSKRTAPPSSFSRASKGLPAFDVNPFRTALFPLRRSA
jgi:hypothetical protein